MLKVVSIRHTLFFHNFVSSASTFDTPVICVQAVQRFEKSHEINTTCTSCQNKKIIIKLSQHSVT